VKLHVTLVQQSLAWHDPAANRERLDALCAPLANNTDVIVLPEMFTTGFSMEPEKLFEPVNGPTSQWLQAKANELNAALTGSLIVKDGERYYNRLLWAAPDTGLLHYDKRHLFRMANEHQRYAEGRDKLLVEIGGWRVCPLVCYDLRFPVWSRNRFDPAAQRFDYDLLLYVANWPSARRHAWRTLLQARAIENLSYVVGVNRVGVDGNELHYAGDSVALDPLGMPLVELGAQPQSVLVTLSGAALVAHRTRFPAQLDADDFRLELAPPA
jgi:omega-amidase